MKYCPLWLLQWRPVSTGLIAGVLSEQQRFAWLYVAQLWCNKLTYGCRSWCQIELKETERSEKRSRVISEKPDICFTHPVQPQKTGGKQKQLRSEVSKFQKLDNYTPYYYKIIKNKLQCQVWWSIKVNKCFFFQVLGFGANKTKIVLVGFWKSASINVLHSWRIKEHSLD